MTQQKLMLHGRMVACPEADRVKREMAEAKNNVEPQTAGQFQVEEWRHVGSTDGGQEGDTAGCSA